MPYSTVAEAQEYHPAASSQPAKAFDVLADAADFVARLAPPPRDPVAGVLVVPVPLEYADRAARCERRLFAYLWDTGGGYITRSDISGAVSDSFTGIAGVQAIVESIMGEYATSALETSGSGASYTMDIQSSFPSLPLDTLPTP